MNAIVLKPPTDQQREWIKAFGLSWRWTDILYNTEYQMEVIKSGREEPATDCDERTIH